MQKNLFSFCSRILLGAFLLLGVLACGRTAAAFTFVDPLDAPSLALARPDLAPMIGVAVAGDHFVAVGSRGVIIYSTPDGGWQQASDPVQSDLTDVQFIDANNGWACGHDGVILHSTDGGKTWVKQLDGIAARKMFEDSYNQQIAAGNKNLADSLQQIQANYDNGPNLPWLAIWFNSPQNGFVVGSFGDIAVTNDGGKTWQPWLENIDNSQYLDLNAVATINGQTYIAGEQGTVYWLDMTKNNGQGAFVARPTTYQGMLFGITGKGNTIIAYGMRSQIFRSEDEGKTWTNIPVSTQSGIMNGTYLPDGTVVMVTLDGTLLFSHDDGKSFVADTSQTQMPLTDVAAIDPAKILVTGLGGVQYVSQK